MTNDPTRRAVLGTIGGAATAGVAGCLGAAGSSNDGGKQSVAASFFVLGDFASQVAGDAAAVETLVPVGQHGHGWEPDPRVTQRAVDADAFVYMAEGFQPWADDVVRNVRDGDSETLLIEGREGVDLLPAGGGHDEGGHDDHGGHGEEETDHEETHGEDGDDHHDEDGGDHHDGDGNHHDEHADEDDHGPVDPHFWLDPTRAATAVEAIRDGFQRLDDANAATYAENASTYHDALLDLDAEFEEALDDRSRDTVLVAGHDAFQYLGERYDVEVVGLTGISPDDSATTDDVRRAQEAIENHGVRHVLAPVMESDQAAQSLVADTDAEAVLPITALPGRHQEWADQGWGYEAVMREVNLPTLRTALGVE